MQGFSRTLVPFFSNEAHYYLCSALGLSLGLPLSLSVFLSPSISVTRTHNCTAQPGNLFILVDWAVYVCRLVLASLCSYSSDHTHTLVLLLFAKLYPCVGNAFVVCTDSVVSHQKFKVCELTKASDITGKVDVVAVVKEMLVYSSTLW